MVDSERGEYNSAYTRACALSVLSAVAFGLLLILPKYVGRIFYEGTEMTQADKAPTIQWMNIFYMIVSLLYIIAFIVQACQQKTPADEEIAIDSDDDGIDTSSDEEDEEVE